VSTGARTATVTVAAGQVGVAGVIDFDNAARVLDEVRVAIRATASVTIDLGEVQRSNSVGLALLIEWLAEARRLGHSVRFERVPEGLRQIARVCQVESLLAA